ncbi:MULTISPECIES: hypothetical protein [Paenibacillus]|uniref:Uncharacterized protein n=1 Tax=Paenibacillus residui TaxID=629724 RepID=A0ABW3D964_9BACL|nr:MULTISPECIES: hypothetical protein [Paenibacillaceae]
MQWMMSWFRGRNRRNAVKWRRPWMMSALALAVGATAVGLARGRGANVVQRVLQPFRNRRIAGQ